MTRNALDSWLALLILLAFVGFCVAAAVKALLAEGRRIRARREWADSDPESRVFED